jgi:hypothetical protein
MGKRDCRDMKGMGSEGSEGSLWKVWKVWMAWMWARKGESMERAWRLIKALGCMGVGVREGGS